MEEEVIHSIWVVEGKVQLDYELGRLETLRQQSRHYQESSDCAGDQPLTRGGNGLLIRCTLQTLVVVRYWLRFASVFAARSQGPNRPRYQLLKSLQLHAYRSSNRIGRQVNGERSSY